MTRSNEDRTSQLVNQRSSEALILIDLLPLLEGPVVETGGEQQVVNQSGTGIANPNSKVQITQSSRYFVIGQLTAKDTPSAS